jgi:serine/threonine-protein kinase
MPTPATALELLDLIRRSRVVDEVRLARFLSGERGNPAPPQLLSRLVAAGLLTSFQADLLAQGKWRGFALGCYRVLDRVGTGGMSQVFLAEHATLRQRVAVKVLNAPVAGDPLVRERFIREARVAASLAHPNIVRVLDVDPDAPAPFLVMEYIDGTSLQAAVARHGTFDAGAVAYCGRQIALGLQQTSDAGLVHRDIKPANVLVDRRGVVKILDLGVVRVVESADALTRRVGEKLLLGTADYVAPEQAADCSAVDSRADVYALGGTLYFLLAGHPPFPEGSAIEKVARKQAADPTPLRQLRPDVPAKLAAVIHRMLARDPAERFASPSQAAAALAPFARPEADFPARLFAEQAAPPADISGDSTEVPSRSPEGAATDVIPVKPATVADFCLDAEPPTEVRIAAPPRRTEWLLVGGIALLALLAIGFVLRL